MFMLAVGLTSLLLFCHSVSAQTVGEIKSQTQTEFGVYVPYLVKITPSVATYTVNSDFSNVTNYSSFSSQFSAADRALLLSNQFVVKPDFNGSIGFKQISSLYNSAYNSGTPIFVTTDAMLHTFHILYDYSLRILEVNKFASDIKVLTDTMLAKMKQYELQMGNDSLGQIVSKNVAYFSVAKMLGDPSLRKTAMDMPPEAISEYDLIDAHQGFHESTIFGYDEDYSQYVPRGHYTRNDTLKNYFRTMMWYGRMMFRLSVSEGEDPQHAKAATLMAILITRAMNESTIGSEQATAVWQKIYYPTTFYVGKSDDLTIDDYTRVIKEVYGDNYLSLPPAQFANDSKLTEFMDKAKQLQDPLINSSWVSESEDAAVITKGFRFMGQRFIPDSYMFTKLVADFVPARLLPKGLDVFAVLGSGRAFNILDKVYHETNFQGYASQIDSLKSEFSKLPVESWAQNLYWNWLYCLAALLQPAGDGYPPFMKNVAWLDKELSTALGSWSELRHDTILYAKQSYTALTAEPPAPFTYGYVEPNPQLFGRLASLVQLLRDGLDNMGLSENEFASRFTDLESLLLGLKSISEKELTNVELTKTEYQLIWTIGERIEDLTTFPADVASSITNDTDDEMAVVADVHTDPNSGTVLEEGSGYPFPIYVIVNDTHGLRIVMGGVFSYYEFTQPMSNRLTDENWQSMLKSTTPPATPVWYGSFIDTTQSTSSSYLMAPEPIYHQVHDLQFSVSPSSPKVGDTLSISLNIPWASYDRVNVVFYSGDAALDSAALTHSAQTGLFTGSITTNGWPNGTIKAEANCGGSVNAYWFGFGDVSGIYENENLPTKFQLSQNYPNPFNPSTVISYQLTVNSFVTLKVYDVLGREVSTLVNGKQNAGYHSITFDGGNLPSGVYLCHIQAGTFSATRKMLLLK